MVTTFFKYCCRRTGQSLKDFVQRSRIRTMQLQLALGDKTVAQLAFEYSYAEKAK